MVSLSSKLGWSRGSVSDTVRVSVSVEISVSEVNTRAPGCPNLTQIVSQPGSDHASMDYQVA